MKTPIEFLAECPVPHVVIGGHAIRAYGYARQTVDFDCMIATESIQALGDFLKKHDYCEAGRVASFIRFWHKDRTLGDLDVMPVDAATFAKINTGSREIDLGGFSVRVPRIAHLVALKLHAIKSNPQRELKDGADIVELLRLNPNEVSDSELKEVCDHYAPPGYFEKLKDFLSR
jgi:hypothetical protein